MSAIVIIAVFCIIAGHWAIEECYPIIAIPCVLIGSLGVGILVAEADLVAGIVLAIALMIGGIGSVVLYDD